MNSGDLQHGNEQGGLVFAVAVAVAKDVGGVVGLEAADTAHDDEVPNVFLNVVCDTAQLSVEVGRTGDELLHLGGDFGRGVGAIGFEFGDPLTDGAPLIVFAFDGGFAPLNGHALGQRRPFGCGRDIAEGEGGLVLQLPSPVIGGDLDRFYGLVVVPGISVGMARRQVDFKGLVDDGNAGLEGPDFLLKVGLHQLFGFAEDGGAHITGGRMGDAGFASGEHGGNIGVALLGEVSVLGLILLFVGGDGPHAEVVDLLTLVVADFAGVATALRLKDANGFALTLDGATLGVDGFNVFVKEDHRGGVFGVVGGTRFRNIEAPLRERLAFVEPATEAGLACREKECRDEDASRTGRDQKRGAHVSFLWRQR